MAFQFQIQTRDMSVLRSLFESRVMTNRHIAEVHFEGRGDAAKKRLQTLKAAGLISDRRRRVVDPSILFLSGKGLRFLKSEGILNDFPKLSIPTAERRSRVSELTIRHELQVQDVKAAFCRAMRGNACFAIEEFSTWPLLFEFAAQNRFSREILIKPDGFIRLHEKEEASLSEHSFFLEVDRSTEVQETLANRAGCYFDYYKSGGFAEWRGGSRLEPNLHPFRVLMVFKSAERRNNLAERLLQFHPPIYTHALLTTIAEVMENPLGKIWIRPREYFDITKGTTFDPDRAKGSGIYRRQTERDFHVEAMIRKRSLFEK